MNNKSSMDNETELISKPIGTRAPEEALRLFQRHAENFFLFVFAFSVLFFSFIGALPYPTLFQEQSQGRQAISRVEAIASPAKISRPL